MRFRTKYQTISAPTILLAVIANTDGAESEPMMPRNTTVSIGVAKTLDSRMRCAKGRLVKL